MRWFAQLLLLLGAGVTAACQYSPGMNDRALAYQRAVASSNDQRLLINVMRASRRYPTHYARLEGSTSTGTISPQFSMSIPLSDAISATTAPAGLTSLVSRAALSLTPQFGATESNAMILQSLDDAKYIRGMMTPVDFDVYNGFLSAGWSQELLALVFIQGLEGRLDKQGAPELDITPEDRKEFARSVRKVCIKAQAGTHQEALCKAVFVKGDSNAPLLDCLKPAGYGNLFAVQNDGDNVKTAGCFQTVLRALLVLGFHPGKKTEAAKGPVVVQRRLNMNFKNDPKFLNTILSNNLIAVETKDEGIAVCKADAGKAAGSSGPANTNVQSPSAIEFRLASTGKGGPSKSDIEKCLKAVADLAKSEQQAKQAKRARRATQANGKPNGKPNGTANGAADPEEYGPVVDPYLFPYLEPEGYSDVAATAFMADSGGTADICDITDTKNSKCQITFAVRMRSTQGMIEYLGEIARYATERDNVDAWTNPSVEVVTVYGPNKRIPLFVVERGNTPSNAALSIDFEDQSYFLRQASCRKEQCQDPHFSLVEPASASLDVLRLLVQLWGLHKEQSGLPIAQPVVIAQ